MKQNQCSSMSSSVRHLHGENEWCSRMISTVRHLCGENELVFSSDFTNMTFVWVKLNLCFKIISWRWNCVWWSWISVLHWFYCEICVLKWSPWSSVKCTSVKLCGETESVVFNNFTSLKSFCGEIYFMFFNNFTSGEAEPAFFNNVTNVKSV